MRAEGLRGWFGGELAWTSWLHVWNDGLTAALAVLLPFIARDFHLGYARAGLVRTAHLITLSLGQVPATVVAARAGEAVTLGGALVWFGASFVLLSTAAWFSLILVWGAVAGAGAAAYHPIATDYISTRAGERHRGRAIGALYFCGDVGKFAIPAAAGALAAAAGWRESLGVLGAVGALSGLVYLRVHLRRFEGLRVTRRPGPPFFHETPGPGRPSWGIRHLRLFSLMAVIGVFDQGLRSGVVTFLPFLLVARGFGKAEVGALAALIFAGGALGKLAGGWLTDLFGRRLVIAPAECLVAVGLVVLLGVRSGAALAVYLTALGVVLNGTSSALYAGLAPVVDRTRGSRGYGVFLTITFAATALAPPLFGLLADRSGLTAVFWALAILALLVPPFALLLPGRSPD